ncbi:MAG: type II secretion system F family protein [Bdellovibrionales bacterium]|nr:type II secretion system F family protein [Bdellovibrionales bacterium]
MEFQYRGVDKKGRKVEGKVDAPNEGEVRMILRGQGIRPTGISKVSALNTDLGSLLGGSGKVSIEGLVVFTRQLHVLISSGVPLVQSLEVLQDQMTDRALKSILSAVKEKVSGGAFLWEALSTYPKAFPRIYLALIRAGESSGAMDTMLKRLSTYLEDADRIRKMLKSAMTYPIVVISIGIGVVFAMLAFVIPKFEELLTSAGQELPGPTKFVIDASHFVVGNFFYLVTGTIALVYVINRYVKSDEGRAVMHRVLFRAPLFGNLTQKAGVARFCRTMSTLLSSGVTLVDAIDICRMTIDNTVLEDAVSKIRADVESGKTLGAVVGKISVFPRMAVQMITVGETTGNLDRMMDKVADFYEQEVEQIVGGMSKLIEPFVLVFLGGAVGGLMIAMYLPIFKLAGSAGS